MLYYFPSRVRASGPVGPVPSPTPYPAHRICNVALYLFTSGQGTGGLTGPLGLLENVIQQIIPVLTKEPPNMPSQN